MSRRTCRLIIFVAAAVLTVVATDQPVGARARAADRERAATIDARAVSAGAPIVLDGRFDEAVWQSAPVIGEFIQREPAEGAAPSEATEARVAFDAVALYVAVRAFDREPARITGQLTRRDERSPSDWLKVAVDSYFDHRTAYEFGVNPAGVKTDRYYFNDGQNDDSWDAVWDVQVARDGEGWTAEFRIPFSQLRFARGGGPVGLAIIRELQRANETSTWPLLARSANGFVSQFGTITGLETDGARRRLELMPYGVGEVQRQTPETGNPLSDATDPGVKAGLDLKYAVTPALTLTATLNPDFGQVEADPAAVNLDAFELFFAERRPFFVEGSGVFRFNMDCNDGDCSGLLYSRRIGRAPQGEATLGDDEYADAPSVATILGAAKLTGRVGKFSVGALSAFTQEEQATIASGLDRRRQVVEPLTGFNVLRARREFANQSNLGVMLTSTTRQQQADTRFLADQAFAGGVDYDWRLGPMYSVNGFLAGSRLSGTTDAITRIQQNAVHYFQRPDSDATEFDAAATALGGHAGSVALAKIGGQKLRFSANYGYKTPGFDANDLGFQRRADERTMNHWVQLRDQTPGRYVRQYMINFNQWAAWNFDGDRLFGGGNINMHWTFQNNWRTGFGVNLNGGGLRDRATRGGPGVLFNRNVSLWHYVELDERRSLFPAYNGFYQRDGFGTSRVESNPRLVWRPSRAVRVDGGLRAVWNNDDAQWVENVTDADAAAATHYVFGRLEQRTLSMTLRANYTMSPTLSFQSYAEPFVSAGRYMNYKELTNGRDGVYAQRFQPYAYASNADFNIRSFRTTNVLRWEFKPGSALFAVWQQGRYDEQEQGDFRFGRDFGGLFSSPSRNTFLVKFSYWFNY